MKLFSLTETSYTSNMNQNRNLKYYLFTTMWCFKMSFRSYIVFLLGLSSYRPYHLLDRDYPVIQMYKISKSVWSTNVIVVKYMISSRISVYFNWIMCFHAGLFVRICTLLLVTKFLHSQHMTTFGLFGWCFIWVCMF